MAIRKIRTLLLLGGIMLALPPAAAGQVFDLSQMTILNSNEILDTTYGEHGGLVVRRDNFLFESVVGADGVLIYVYDPSNKRLDPAKAVGTVKFSDDKRRSVELTLERKRDRKETLRRFRCTAAERGYHLFAPYDFSMSADGLFQWRAQISGLPGQTKETIRYALQFGLTRLQGWCCRGHEHRIFLDYKDYALCEKAYLDIIPFLYQCPQHEQSRSDRESKCPICSTQRVATPQNPHAHIAPKPSRSRQP
jgi:hypothetical protein